VFVLLIIATPAYAATTGDQTQTPGTSVTRQIWGAKSCVVRLNGMWRTYPATNDPTSPTS
jgi:hypothetical protein